MEFRKPPIKAIALALALFSAITLAAANGLRNSVSDDAQYINYLQSLLDQRPFLKRQWSKGKAQPFLNKAIEEAESGDTDTAIQTLQTYLRKDPSHYLTLWKLLQYQSHNATPLQMAQAANRFLKQLPDFGPALLVRANAYEQMQRNSAAEKDFRAALKDPILNDKDRFSANQSIYYLTKQKGDTETAHQLLASLLKTNPKSVNLTKEYALTLEQRSEHQAAIGIWDQIPKLTRDKHLIAEAQQAKAALLQKLGKSDEALLLLSNLEGQSDNTADREQQLRFAKLYIKKEKPAQAIKYLTDSDNMLLAREQIEPNQLNMSYQQYLRMVADLALKLNRHPLAIDAITQLNVLASSPQEKFRWLAMLGTIQQNDGRYQSALGYFKRALRLKEDLSLRIQTAEVAWHLQNYREVASLLQPASEQLKSAKRPRQVKARHRLCEAHEKNRDYKKALSCTDKLLKQNPKDRALLLSAADLAAKSDKESAQLEYLVTAKNLSRPTNTGLRKTYQREKQVRSKKALEWFRKAYKEERNFASGYAYASALLKAGQRDAAIIILSRIVNLKDSSTEDRYKAHHALGYAMAANGDFVGAAQSWDKADRLHPTPVLKLRRTWALYSANNLEKSSNLLTTVKVEELPTKEQITWYELRGMIRFKQGQYTDSITAREYVVKESPTAKHWSQLAQSYAAVHRIHDADNAYEQAIAKSHGDKSGYVLQRAYLKISDRKYAAAQILLDQALQSDPENPLIEEELGYAYARLNMNQQAAEHFKLAVNHYQSDALSGRMGARKAMEKRNRISQNIALLEQGLKLTAYVSGNLTSVAAVNNNASLIAPFRVAGSGLEVSYQPKSFGYRNGKQLQFFARGLWAGSNDSIAPDTESNVVGTGVRYKPLAKHDAWVSVEHLAGLGDQADDNSLARVTYRNTRGLDWPLDDDIDENERKRLFGEVYLDIAKLLENDAPTLAYAEARLGKSWVLDDNWITSPHGYLRAQGEFGDDDQHIVDAGVGFTAKYRGAYDFYEGYKADSEIYLRLGQDIDNSDNDAEKETRATFGLKFSY